MVAQEDLPFVYQRVAVVATAPSRALTVAVGGGETAPVTVAMITASGGSGGLRFEVAGDDAGVATVGGDGEVVVTNLLASGEGATVSVVVWDSTPVNSAEVAVTVAFVAPLSFASSATGFVVSPGYVGVVHSLAVTGGFGSYAFERVAGASAVEVGASSGVVSLVTALPAGSLETVVFAVRDEGGRSARFTLSLRVDDLGAFAEYREGDMFLIGGFDGGLRNDVWRSSDGENWVSVPVSGGHFSGRGWHQAVSYGGSLWVIGGYDGQNKNDVWRSSDGENWVSVSVSGGHFSGRQLHRAVSYGGSLWVIGGYDGQNMNDVWRSSDGENWDLVPVSGGHFSGRHGHQVVSYGGSLWVIGGLDGSQNKNDVWRSSDGENWDLVPVSGGHFSGRNSHQAVSYGGSLWVIGGHDGSSSRNDVWRSSDGENWVSVSISGGHFSERQLHQAVSYGGSLWVIGGQEDRRQRRNDVWRSVDGENWVSVPVSGGHFSGRWFHQVVVHQVPLPFVYEVAEVAVGSVGVLTVFADGGLPLTVGTLTASGGSGGLRFEVVGDERGVATVGATDGVLVATAFLGSRERATVSVRVDDGTPVNAATVAVTLFFVAPLAFPRASVAYVVSPDFVGAVHSLVATGGVGEYAYSRVSGPSAMTVDAASGVVSLTAGLPVGDLTAVFAVQDGVGNSARFTLNLEVAGSGAFADRDAMLVIGGYDGQFRNDVWRSSDGENWVSVPVSGGHFSGRAYHQAVSYGGSLWVVGGNDGSRRNDVWRSSDGENWVSVSVSGGHFSGREGHQAVSYGGSLWVIGGNDGQNKNDVWRSSDGENWDLVTVSGGHFSGRVFHQAVSYGGSLWVIGGYDGQNKNDVWRSSDGENWVSVPVSGGRFSGRGGHQAVSYGGSLWVIGGNDGQNKNDVWRSSDGENWVSVPVSGGHFSGRGGHQAVSYGGSLWVIGGNDGQNKNDVWRSSDGENWDLVTVSGGHFSGREGHQVVVLDPGRYSYEVAPVVAEPVAVQTIFVENETVPLTLLTLEATGGTDRLRFDVTDERGVLSVGVDGVLVVTNFVPGYVTATVRVRDSTPVNSAMVTVTMAHVFPMSLSPAVTGYVFSPGYTGVVHSLVASGGLGIYTYERVSGPLAVSVDAGRGIVSLVSALPAGSRELAVFEVRDEIGGSARSTLSLSIADSSEDYAMEMMYLLGRHYDGGRWNSYVWHSADGANWAEVPVSTPLWVGYGRAVSHRGSLWVFGGNEVWRSADGIRWTRDVAAFSGRSNHQAVSYGGSLWVIGGDDGQRRNDVWRSSDGENWVSVSVSGGHFSGRESHQAVSYGGSLWVIGGYDGQSRNDVWRLSDGENWVSVSVSGGHFSGRDNHQAVSYGGSLWVIGGYDGRDKSDVWRSADGENWELVTVSGGHFSRRQLHQAVSYGGSLWVIGGWDGQWRNDVWRSSDGESWELVTDAAAFPAGGYHQVAVFRPSEYFHEATEILADSPGVQTVPINGTVPLTLVTLEATGGVGGMRFEMAGDDAGVATVGTDGALVVTNFLADGVTATVSVRVRDSAPINNRAVVAVTLAFDFPLSFVSLATEFVVSPDYAGVLHTLTAAEGVGDYAYSRVAGNSAVTVDAASGVVSLVSALPVGSRATVVFAVTDEGGGSARFTMSLRVDDSGAFVTEYRDGDMFLIGGGRRVWRSADGVNWANVFSWQRGSWRGHQAVSYGGSMWLVGGNDGQKRNYVWRSADGVSWDLVRASGDVFSGRWLHQVVSHGGSMWVVGGDDGRHRSDVWRSADGRGWEVATLTAAFSERRHHQAVSYGGSLWVLGGSEGSKYLNDVWRSADGANWTEVTVSGEYFSGRYGHHAVSYGGSLWVIGGSDDYEYFNDVWRSADGVNWVSVTVSGDVFSGRWGHYAVSYGGSLWVMGGYDDDKHFNDVWRSADGMHWEVATLTAAFSAQWGHQVVVGQEPLPFVYEVAEVAVGSVGVLTVFAYGALSLTVGDADGFGGERGVAV